MFKTKEQKLFKKIDAALKSAGSDGELSLGSE
jgi:hypothetical protein